MATVYGMNKSHFPLSHVLKSSHQKQSFIPHEAKLILSTSLNKPGQGDSLKWWPHKLGKFSVKSAYSLIIKDILVTVRFHSPQIYTRTPPIHKRFPQAKTIRPYMPMTAPLGRPAAHSGHAIVGLGEPPSVRAEGRRGEGCVRWR
ncbi:retrotransposon protein [Striga asiatica]|uniref:Retrotransposon protein n=1 Tax=Striga asiatica TaxID=4170 RepID=A0A5A7REV5_STRAF|nr:retrotransposon protein [Striga asiatica]